LTDLYNENYLKTVLGTKERKQGYLTLVQLKRFADYNQKMGWNGGNRFLKDFGAMLKELYPQAMVFRYHGDGFVLLFDHVVDVSEEQLAALPLLRENNMEVHLRHYNLKEGIPEL
jgi:GGDEF domain-containing protein